jgi:alanine dehydrogenase
VPLLLKIAANGGVKATANSDFGFRNGMYLYNGILVNRLIGQHFGLSFNDIGLLMGRNF